MSSTRLLRYLAPNLVTSLGIVCGLLSMVAAFEHRFADAGWLIIWAVLIDRIDGLVARAFRATSSFGVQMDSFADSINFGVAPSVLIYSTLVSVPELGLDTGGGLILLLASCGLWTLANVFRLAKFNVITEDPSGGPKMFFGVPTTLAAGMLMSWYLVFLQYTPLGVSTGQAALMRGPHLLGDLMLPTAVWGYLPAAMLVAAFLMASNLPTPKLGRLRSNVLTVIVIGGATVGFFCGVIRVLPEVMVLMPSTWLVVSLVWGQFDPKVRSLVPPSFLPAHDEVAASETTSSDEPLR